MSRRAYIGADIFDGRDLHTNAALLLDGEVFIGTSAADNIPRDYDIVTLNGGVLMPGFVDLQVNGGGGVMFNDETSLEGLKVIAAAHRTTGTRAFLPTLITDTPERTRAAVDAVAAAIDAGVPGIVGIHLEGPHLSIARKGAHDPSLIRRMSDDDEAFLQGAVKRVPNVMVTIAPENVSTEQVSRLASSGVILSLGHTDCSFDEAEAAFAAGVRCVTHLFNAMSQIGSREPGLVGAALQSQSVSAGLIADNIHVHTATMRLALSSKRAPGRVFLVTDSMSTVGSDITEFSLNGRRVLRRENRLSLEDGTLAGADLELSTALSNLIDRLGVTPATAYAMATAYPAEILRDSDGFGSFDPGCLWNGIYLGVNGRYQPLSP